MRTLAVLGAALACGISSLGAQRAHQFELGAFGSFTRYDQVFNLDNQIGGGGRLGYFFSNVVSAELDGGYQSPNPKTGSASPTLAHGSASLVLNFGTARNLFYVLGGYSRLDFAALRGAWLLHAQHGIRRRRLGRPCHRVPGPVHLHEGGRPPSRLRP